MAKEILLCNASEKLTSISRDLKVSKIPRVQLKFATYLARFVPKRNPISAYQLIFIVNAQIEILKSTPNLFTEDRKEIFDTMQYFPLIVDLISSEEFSNDFRKCFNRFFSHRFGPAVAKKYLLNLTESSTKMNDFFTS